MLDELNVTTLKEIAPLVAQDNYFLGAPMLMAWRARNRFVPFNGGTEMQSNFLFRGLPTQAYTQGTEFVPIKRQILASISHVPKFYVGLVTEFLEDLEVFNTGPNAVFSIIESDLAALFMSSPKILTPALMVPAACATEIPPAAARSSVGIRSVVASFAL
jgi:hypothetical protein